MSLFSFRDRRALPLLGVCALVGAILIAMAFLAKERNFKSVAPIPVNELSNEIRPAGNYIAEY